MTTVTQFNRNYKMWRFTILLLLFIIPLVLSFVISSPINPISSNNNDASSRGSTQPPITAESPMGNNTPVSGYDNSKRNNPGVIEITNFRCLGDVPETNFFYEEDYVAHEDPEDFDFNQTITNATEDNSEISGGRVRSSYITIFVSEVISWTYEADVTDFIVGFQPYLQTNTQLDFILVNGSEADEDNYYQEYLPGSMGKTKVFYYNFSSHFETDTPGEFTLTYFYKLDVNITTWIVETVVTPDTDTPDYEPMNTSVAWYNYITNTSSEIAQIFEYKVSLGSAANPLLDSSAIFKIHFPESEDIYDVEFKSFNGDPYIPPSGTFDEENKILEFANWTNLDRENAFYATFMANFTVEFIDTVGGNARWCEDRLIDGLNERQRSYKLTITEGPENLMAIWFGFNITTIWFEELLADNPISSELGRDATAIDINDTVDEQTDILVPESNYGLLMLQRGLNPYYMFGGEVDIITVAYTAHSYLAYTVTDNIKVPLANMQTKVYRYDYLYGTVISPWDVRPMAIQESDDQGQVYLINMPRGEYRIEVLNTDGSVLNTFTIETDIEANQNLLITSIVHFPQVILTIAVVGIILIVIGYIIFKKNR